MAFSQLKIFFVGKNRGRKWQQRKPESQHPQRDLDGEYITGIYGFQFQHHTCGRKTPRRRFQASKLCILRFERWKNIQNFTKKKTSLRSRVIKTGFGMDEFEETQLKFQGWKPSDTLEDSHPKVEISLTISIRDLHHSACVVNLATTYACS